MQVRPCRAGAAVGVGEEGTPSPAVWTAMALPLASMQVHLACLCVAFVATHVTLCALSATGRWCANSPCYWYSPHIWGPASAWSSELVCHMLRQGWGDVQGRQRGDQAEGGAGPEGEGGAPGGPSQQGHPAGSRMTTVNTLSTRGPGPRTFCGMCTWYVFGRL